MNSAHGIVGRAKTVLLFEQDRGIAVVATVFAQRLEDGPGFSLRMVGPVSWDRNTLTHVRETVVGAVDSVLGAVCGDRCRGVFGLSFVNLSAASTSDIGLSVRGFSADAAVFTALLSAALGLPVRQDVVITAHVASMAGDLRPVGGLEAKLNAAVADPDVREFLCPNADTDTSLASLAPSEREEFDTTILRRRHDVRITGVSDVGELINQAIREDDLVLGSLRSGFFEQPNEWNSGTSPCKRVAAFGTLIRSRSRRPNHQQARRSDP